VVEEGVRVSDPVIVQALNPIAPSLEEAERLVAALQDEGLEVWRYKVEKQEGFAPRGTRWC
jgi:hypothetical protein